MEFIKNVLRFPLRAKIWRHQEALLYFTTNRYQIHEELIGNVKALFLFQKGTIKKAAD